MKVVNVFKVIVTCLFSLNSTAQNLSKSYNLPGFVQINDSVFISRVEISIREYGRFMLIWKRESGDPNLFTKAFPSPNYLGWTFWSDFSNSLVSYSEQYEIIEKYHHSRPQIDTSISYYLPLGDRPVVNVTKQQADLYCTFRTMDYQIFFKSLNKRKKTKYPSNLVFRLPTSGEWLIAASSGLDTATFPYGSEVEYDEPVSYRTFSSDTSGQSHPFDVLSGHLNRNKLINMCGNVAELVSDNDYAYGGSFLDMPEQCTVTSKQLFISPKNNVGFRVVAVIRE